jgi:hypothetical protein
MGVENFITGFAAWGTNISTVLQDWDYIGIFEYVLPFLLIFAVIYGILIKSNVLGDSKGVNMVISLAIALIAVASLDLRNFFSILFPYTGVGVAILLVLLILTGLFYNGDNTDKWWRITFFVIAMVIGFIVVMSALTNYTNWGLGGWWWQEYINAIIVAIIIIGLIVLVVFTTKKSGGSGKP